MVAQAAAVATINKSHRSPLAQSPATSGSSTPPYKEPSKVQAVNGSSGSRYAGAAQVEVSDHSDSMEDSVPHTDSIADFPTTNTPILDFTMKEMLVSLQSLQFTS